MSAYFEEFANIDQAVICTWIFELEGQLSKINKKKSSGPTLLSFKWVDCYVYMLEFRSFSRKLWSDKKQKKIDWANISPDFFKICTGNILCILMRISF